MYSQILDDSTHSVYGPKTTLYHYLDDLIYDKDTLYSLDTSIAGIHENKYILGDEYQQYQHLGNYSSAQSGVYYQEPNQIGRNLGIDIFDNYVFDNHNIKYYDAKSPLTSVDFVQTTSGQQTLDVRFSRNIGPQFNFGFVYRKLSSLKQIGLPEEGEKYAEPLGLQFFSSFKSRNHRYKALFSVSHLFHLVQENGGIASEGNSVIDDFFDYELEDVNLNSVDVFETRHDFHFYHQYALAKKRGLQLFHQFDNYRRYDKYADFNYQSNIDYYQDRGFGTNDTVVSFGDTITSSTVELIRDRVIYRNYENKVGVKGTFSTFYYQVYLRHKYLDYTVRGKQFENNQSYFEQFIGGKLKVEPTDDFKLESDVEFGLGRDYLVNPRLKYKSYEIGLKLMSYSPTLLQQRYQSILFDWDNRFRNTDLQQIKARGIFSIGDVLTLVPSIEVTNLQKYVYYNQQAEPEQDKNNLQIISPVLKYNTKVNLFPKGESIGLHLEGFLKYYKTSSVNSLRAPEWLWQNRAYLESRIFKKQLLFRLGIDLKRQSSYLANDYTPVTQVFYLQDDFSIPSYWQADVFFNFKVKSARIFLRSQNVFADILGNDKGYFVSPYYSGLPTSFDFGVNWAFFD